MAPSIESSRAAPLHRKRPAVAMASKALFGVGVGSPDAATAQASKVEVRNCIGPTAWSQTGSPVLAVLAGVAGMAMLPADPSRAGPRIGGAVSPDVGSTRASPWPDSTQP